MPAITDAELGKALREMNQKAVEFCRKCSVTRACGPNLVRNQHPICIECFNEPIRTTYPRAVRRARKRGK